MVKDYLGEIKVSFNNLLYKEIGGRTVKDWLLVFGGYSFVLWFAILGYIAYKFYGNYQILKERENEKLAILERKNRQISHIKEQIKEIRKAYDILKSYFPSSRVAALKTLLQKDFDEQQKKFKNWQKFASEKYLFPKGQQILNKDIVPIYKFQFQDMYLLSENMQQFQRFYSNLLNTNAEIKGDINLARLSNYYVLYFNPGKSNHIIVKSYKYYGYIKNIFKINIPIDGSYLSVRQLKLHDYSKPFVIGWYLELPKGGF